MLTEEKKACLDNWLWIKVTRIKQYFIDLGYLIYKDYKGKSYFVIHPWDLPKSSSLKLRVTCSMCKNSRASYQTFNS